MSAYIVDDSTINTILAGFQIARHDSLNFPNLGDLESYFNADPAMLGQKMFDLNVLSINERYGEGQAEKFRDLNYTFRTELPPTRIQLHKSLRCFLYQACEGRARKIKLFTLLDEYTKDLAEFIVTSTPQWESAQWG